ncbi:MAG: glycosyltransferase family 2 protein, partial [Deltaproteobacteria bacterium]|nr:glycosyltransferase family 2 protein [Deltaproteobacteria bacterium]
GLALMALVVTLVNLLTWPRGIARATDAARWSVLIPARNEEQNIEVAIRSVFTALPEVGEVVVCDDHSTDRTPEILSGLQREFPRLRVIAGRTLPDGVVGKPHACMQLGYAATGDRLFFLDADVRLEPGAFQRLEGLFARHRAAVVTAVPRQETASPLERLVLPMLHLTYASWLPNALVYASKDVRFLAANGQVLAVERSAYEAIGGYAAVKHEVVDDMALCRRAKERGFRVVFADGHLLARCRMYASNEALWKGFTKNLYEGIGGSLFALTAVTGLYAAAFLAPWALAAASASWSAFALPAAVGVAANLTQRSLLAARHGYGPDSVLLHPLGVLVFLAIAIDSARRTRQGRIEWSGRTYAERSKREVAP